MIPLFFRISSPDAFTMIQNTVYMMIPAPIPICCRFDITNKRGYISAVNNATIKLSANAHRLFARKTH